MESSDNVWERIEALEQQTEHLQHQTQALQVHTRTVERQLRWWRGIACGVGLLGLVSLPLQSGTAADTPPGAMAARMATLEEKLSTMAFDATTNEVVISGANLRIVNGLGRTDTTNGLGNLIVGYNESRVPGCSGSIPGPFCTDNHTGSHNVVVGVENNFSSFGGLVVGLLNEISGAFATVSGGDHNVASGPVSSVSGGTSNTASGQESSVSGGVYNTAWGYIAAVSGGFGNTASGGSSSVSGGIGNTASGEGSSVSGGANRSAPGTYNWVAGALLQPN